MSDLDQLTQVIQVILSNDNQARIQGENLLLSLRQGDFNSYVITFANLLNVSTSKHIRMFCVVHLRRLLSNFVESTKSSQWHTLPNDTQKFLKTLFIEVLQKEEDGPTRRVLCDLIGELASTIKQLDTAKKSKMGEEGQQWDSLMQNIWGFLTSGNIVLMESALKILSILFLYCGKDFAQHKDDLYNILKQALEHDDLRVKASAIEAISSFMGSSFTKDCMAFKDLIPLVLTSTVSIISKNEDLGADVLNELSDILAAECRLFKPYFKEFFTMLKEITQMNLTIDTIRGNALEILVQLIEAIPSVPRNKTEFIKEFFECNYLYMVSCVEDADQQWISPPEGFVDTTDDSNSHEASVKHAMYMIDRVMGKLGSELALPIFSQVLLEVAKVENWKYKHSALMGLSQIGEYIGDAKELDYVVSFTLNFFKDEHPKVRFAALQCIGQFSEDSKPEFQMGYTEKIIPALVGMFSDSVPRVVAHALAAITNFLDGAERGSVSNYIQQVLEPCLGFINQSISFVKEAAVTAVATLAEACEHEFIPYWENTAQLLFQILKDAPDKRYKLLKGSAIECLMLIGQSVGKQEFRKGAHDIIEKLADIQKNYVEEVDPPKSYLLSAWQRICLILGEDFLPYLDHILPLLFSLVEEIVQTQNKTKANETSDMLKALGANKDNLFHKANTAESEDVVLAIKMINVFVLELSKGFGPYVERTSDLLTSLLLRSNNVDLKAISARGLPGLIKVVKETSDPNKQDIIRNLCNKYIEVLWTVIDREKDPETRLVYAMIMSKVLKVSGKVMTEAEVNALGENVFASLKKSDEAKISNQELIEDDEYGVDENEVEAIENENAEEEEYHCALAEVIGSLFEWHPEFALPIAHTIYTKALPNLFVEDMPPKMYKFGLFLVDNLIEHIGYDYLSNEWSMLSQAVIQYVTHSKAEVRHLAAYGIGQLAAKTKGDFQSLAEACMKALLTALDIRKEKDEDAEVYSLTKDNIIAAIGKIIKHQPQAINFKEVTQGWFKMLPLKSDKKEAREQHDLLMNIILNIDPVIIFGQKGENLPQAVKIMAFAVNTKYSYPDFQDKMKKVIEALVGQSDTKSLLQDAFSKLDNNHKEKMKSLLG